jgi:hypothetical protein
MVQCKTDIAGINSPNYINSPNDINSPNQITEQGLVYPNSSGLDSLTGLVALSDWHPDKSRLIH